MVGRVSVGDWLYFKELISELRPKVSKLNLELGPLKWRKPRSVELDFRITVGWGAIGLWKVDVS